MAAEAVKVIVRCRPMNTRELGLKGSEVVKIDSQIGQCSLVNAHEKKAKPKVFTFDGAYDRNSTTEQIYEDIGYPLVEGVTEGYNGTIFAYGQTGCGKSFSMQGLQIPAAQRGIIPRAFDHIFETIQVSEGIKYLVHASYLEIYNEDVRDLLGRDVKAKLELKEHPDKGVYVQGLSMHPCKNVSDCETVMSRGWKNRATGSTNMNAESSRSHSIFTIHLERCDKDAEGEEHIRAAKLNLVDLAGSERQGKTGATGDRLREATKINLSLSALGNVISALVDGRSSHIPYRDSKLTRLLQDSLGGNTKTLMVACLSPADDSYDETLSTLRYANRAKNIRNKPKINEDPKDALLREYQDEIRKLQAMLRGEIPVEIGGGQAAPTVSSAKGRKSEKVVEQVVVQVGSSEEIVQEKIRLRQEYECEITKMKTDFEEMKMSKERLQAEMGRLQQNYDSDIATVEKVAKTVEHRKGPWTDSVSVIYSHTMSPELSSQKVKRVISAKGTRVVVSKQKCKKVASEKQPLTEDLSNPTVSPSLGKRKDLNVDRASENSLPIDAPVCKRVVRKESSPSVVASNAAMPVASDSIGEDHDKDSASENSLPIDAPVCKRVVRKESSPPVVASNAAMPVASDSIGEDLQVMSVSSMADSTQPHDEQFESDVGATSPQQLIQHALHLGTTTVCEDILTPRGHVAPCPSPSGEHVKMSANSHHEALRRDSLVTSDGAIQRLKELEQRVVGGEQANNEEVKERRRKKKKHVEERKRRLADALARMDGEDIMLDIYDNVQEELKVKAKLLEKEKEQTSSQAQEIRDLQAEFACDRDDYLETIRKQQRQVLWLTAVVERLQPCLRRGSNYADLDRVRAQSSWDEEGGAWRLPRVSVERTVLPPTSETNGMMQEAADKDGTKPEANEKPHMNGDFVDFQEDFRAEDRYLQRLHGSSEQELASNYFRSKRADKLLLQQRADDKNRNVRSTISPKNGFVTNGNAAPASSGASSWLTTPCLSPDQQRAAAVHGQVDEVPVRKPARLESLLQPSGGKGRRKKNRLEQL